MHATITRLAAVLSCSLAAPAWAHDASWSQPQTPFRLYGDTYYVGTRGLSAILLASPQGLVLIDGTLPGNAALVEANIRALGFHVKDLRLILNSHAHGDHAGAIAALARDSGATVRASPAGARALQVGGKDADDPQYGDAPLFPPVARVGLVGDGETVRLGPLALTAHFTPGHTPGGTSWTWRSCTGATCLDFAYVDSLSALAAPGYRFSDPAHAQRVAEFRHSFAVVAGLPCEVLITPHPEVSGFLAEAERHGLGAAPPRTPGACRALAAQAQAAFAQRLAAERAGQVP